MNNKFKNAFSIIEISIVILIMGILISGVSKGIDLYQDYNLEVARSLTRNSILTRLDNVRLWYETTLDESFINQENKENNTISIWRDIKKNQYQNEKYHAYGAQRNNSALPTYETNNISKVSGPKYKRDGINGLPTLNFKNEFSTSTSQFMVIDSEYKFEKDDFNIFIVIELNKLISSSCFIIHNPPKGYSANSYISITIWNSSITVATPFSGNYVFYKTISNILKERYRYILELSMKKNSNSWYFSINQKKIASGLNSNATLDDLNFAQMKIGRNYNWNGATGTGTNTDSDFDLSEFIITNGELTILQKQKIEEYLIKKYNIN